MDTKRIDQLSEASTPQGTDLLPLWQGESTRKVKLEDIQASGPAGKDGVSPTVKVSKSGTTTTVTITDAEGEHTATIEDGADGLPGSPGADGFSPTVDIKKDGKTTTITITDKAGPHVAAIEDGADGAGGSGGGSYTLPVASENTLGGVKGPEKTDSETQQVHVDADGAMWVKPPGEGSGGGGENPSGVSLYIEDVGGNPALGNVNFGKYKAGDVVLVVENMEVGRT